MNRDIAYSSGFVFLPFLFCLYDEWLFAGFCLVMDIALRHVHGLLACFALLALARSHGLAPVLAFRLPSLHIHS